MNVNEEKSNDCDGKKYRGMMQWRATREFTAVIRHKLGEIRGEIRAKQGRNQAEIEGNRQNLGELGRNWGELGRNFIFIFYY